MAGEHGRGGFVRSHDARVVTAYVPLPDHPRPIEEYARLGSDLLSLPVPITAFVDPIGTGDVRAGDCATVLPTSLDDCWLYQATRGLRPILPWTDNPRKDSLEYHAIQAEKVRWLAEAADASDESHLVWIDFGILHLRGVTLSHVWRLLEWVEFYADQERITIASIWGPPASEIDPHRIGWWCAGGVAIVPRGMAAWWCREVIQSGHELLRLTGRVTFEVNLWAAVWKRYPTRFVHFLCDHDQSIMEPWK